jgi:hypothetical protein
MSIRDHPRGLTIRWEKIQTVSVSFFTVSSLILTLAVAAWSIGDGLPETKE